MPKVRNLVIGLAAAIFSASSALADTEADDRSYLPPQYLQAQAKKSEAQAAPQAERRIRSTHYETTRRHARGAGLPGILRSLFH